MICSVMPRLWHDLMCPSVMWCDVMWCDVLFFVDRLFQFQDLFYSRCVHTDVTDRTEHTHALISQLNAKNRKSKTHESRRLKVFYFTFSLRSVSWLNVINIVLKSIKLLGAFHRLQYLFFRGISQDPTASWFFSMLSFMKCVPPIN